MHAFLSRLIWLRIISPFSEHSPAQLLQRHPIFSARSQERSSLLSILRFFFEEEQRAYHIIGVEAPLRPGCRRGTQEEEGGQMGGSRLRHLRWPAGHHAGEGHGGLCLSRGCGYGHPACRHELLWLHQPRPKIVSPPSPNLESLNFLWTSTKQSHKSGIMVYNASPVMKSTWYLLMTYCLLACLLNH